jgi:hypothetical protein
MLPCYTTSIFVPPKAKLLPEAPAAWKRSSAQLLPVALIATGQWRHLRRLERNEQQNASLYQHAWLQLDAHIHRNSILQVRCQWQHRAGTKPGCCSPKLPPAPVRVSLRHSHRELVYLVKVSMSSQRELWRGGLDPLTWWLITQAATLWLQRGAGAGMQVR